MTLSQRSAPTWIEKAYRTLTKGVSGAALLAGSAAFTAGCLDRPVTPAVPTTNNVYIDQIRQTGVDKIDLLFMIDNSISMADKQQILAAAVPVLVNRLIAPICLDANDMPTGASSPNCPAGTEAEFSAIEDIHIGVITSSIGDHGSADVCAEGSTMNANATYNDKAQFVPTVYPTLPNRMGLESYNGHGFLVWDPRTAQGGIMPHMPPGFNNPDQFIAAFTDHVTATGENGCGYEAQLESWYRFLVDPEPVNSMTNDGRVSVRGPVNTTVLAQRAAFLRPDSLLAIIMLTDENDCSIVDEAGTQGWLIPFKGGPNANSWRMPRAHAICATNPNDQNCMPCGAGDMDAGCAGGAPYTPAEDAPNVRCFRQKQRFGIDLLYPTSRYVDGLKSIQIDPRYNGFMVENPIYKPEGEGAPPRDAGLVFLAGIVGVPWQDIATPESLVPNQRDLVYMNSEELADSARWPVILGEPSNAVEPLDPFMIEAIDPRPTGLANPILPGQTILPPESTTLNQINGHEQAVIAAERADLQFACIFPLATPTPCDATNEGGCDCNMDEFPKSSPLCTYPNGGTADGRQERAKAYPGLRELQVLKDVGSNAIVASICPKNIQPAPMTSMETDPNYGYNPAVSAIVERLKEALTAKCLPRPLLPEENPQSTEFGKVPCAVVEVRPMVNQMCSVCDPNAGRITLEGEKTKIIPAVQEYLYNNAYCGAPGQKTCNEYCMCELEQFTGPELTTCVETATDVGTQFGYCYVDANVPGYNPELLANCADTEKRILRFMGGNVPARDGLAFIACIGEAASSDVPVMPAMP